MRFGFNAVDPHIIVFEDPLEVALLAESKDSIWTVALNSHA